METLSKCPICHSEDISHSNTIPDHFGNDGSFNLFACHDCTVLFTNPRPDQDEIIKYYKSNSYVSHGNSKGLIFDKVYKTIQNRNMSYKKSLIKRYSLSNKLLDYGCGAGAFIKYMAKNDYQVTGIEPDLDARNQIDNDLLVHANANSINDELFDIITMYHVLEHVHDIQALMIKLKSMLDKNGVLHLALPNYRSDDAQHYQSYWAGYDVPRHLYHFSQRSILQLAEQNGFKVLATHPLKFDSFYCSLLSEQYKKSKFAPINALWHGYRSNLRAKSSGEYSSLIYILTH